MTDILIIVGILIQLILPISMHGVVDIFLLHISLLYRMTTYM